MGFLKYTALLTSLFWLGLTSCSDPYHDLKDGLYAEIHTSHGNILMELFFRETPFSVAQFICLSEGTSPFVADSLRGVKFYSHTYCLSKSAENIYLCGIDSTGKKQPGYLIKKEVSPVITKDSFYSPPYAGMVYWEKMSGATFIISRNFLKPSHDKTTVFGRLIQYTGYTDSLPAVSYIKDIKIIHKGKDAHNFNSVKVLSDRLHEFNIQLQRINKEIQDDRKKINALANGKSLYFKEILKKSLIRPTGMKLVLLQKGTSGKPNEKDSIDLYYSAYTTNGRLFETNRKEIINMYSLTNPNNYFTPHGTQPIRVIYNRRMPLIQGLKDAVLSMQPGDKAIVYIPYYLAYGITGSNRVPPETDLIYEIEIRRPESGN